MICAARSQIREACNQPQYRKKITEVEVQRIIELRLNEDKIIPSIFAPFPASCAGHEVDNSTSSSVIISTVSRLYMRAVMVQMEASGGVALHWQGTSLTAMRRGVG